MNPGRLYHSQCSCESARIRSFYLALGKDESVTYRKVLVFWLPLALAWVLMTAEGPLIQSVISRKPDSETQLAAFGLMFSLSILIETPVIMLLATGSALARNRQAFHVLWRFMMAVNLMVIGVAVLMAFTPLLDFYLDTLLNIPAHIIEATRPAMRIMILWGGLDWISPLSPRHHDPLWQNTLCRLWNSFAGHCLGQHGLCPGRDHTPSRGSNRRARFGFRSRGRSCLYLPRFPRGCPKCSADAAIRETAKSELWRRPASFIYLWRSPVLSHC